ncbi:hypothetical protein SLH49_10845 [Cognatiyoonia sp. IB215446]|uniref:hypothetical protein n=1 Tax=Cognatiyoonia sp. IB215446 TaxID=3097355 RepID=UPI002A0EBEA3|nr:hypothetical protein [Cognatiyoonia sp. IB215446]MDX8348484.1 hypothetical protein [Cognatiyoonia sp. IB215446]
MIASRARSLALARDGYVIVPNDPSVLAWASAANPIAANIVAQNPERRHGNTWFVGVDALPNDHDGSISGALLDGACRDLVSAPTRWHRAQLSIIYPGYPREGSDESAASHRFRRDRDAAHVDGLLPEGRRRHRHLREPHGFVAGIPLDDVDASPLVVWPGSHLMIGATFVKAFAGLPVDRWADEDVTSIYQAARRDIFERCPRIPIRAQPGEVILLHRHLLHGVAPWGESAETRPRMIAYFRPLVAFSDWL